MTQLHLKEESSASPRHQPWARLPGAVTFPPGVPGGQMVLGCHWRTRPALESQSSVIPPRPCFGTQSPHRRCQCPQSQLLSRALPTTVFYAVDNVSSWLSGLQLQGSLLESPMRLPEGAEPSQGQITPGKCHHAVPTITCGSELTSVTLKPG